MLNKNSLQKVLKKIGLFEIFLFLFFLFVVFLIAFFFIREKKSLIVDIKVTRDSILFDYFTPPFWFVSAIKKGDKELNGFGQTEAEVIDLKTYETGDSRREAYIKVKLTAVYNRIQNKYTFSSKDLLIGAPISIKPRGILIEGIVVEIEGISAKTNITYKKVLVQIEQGARETTVGVRPWIADSIQIGDKIRDFNGKTIAEVMDKKVESAVRITTDDLGNPRLTRDPYLEDLFLTLNLSVRDDQGVYYFRDTEKVKVNQQISLFTEKIDTKATVIKMLN